MSQVVDLQSANCRGCARFVKCLAHRLDGLARERFSTLVRRHRVVHRGEHLFFQDDPIQSVFMLRSGSLKIYSLDADGREQVLGFGLPGDTVGLDAVGDRRYHSSVVALETVSVCDIQYAHLEAMAVTIPDLAIGLHQVFGEQIALGHTQIRLLGKKHAEQRLSGFLINLSERFARCGYAANEFNLSMSRHDIGDYLGLALETVSRSLGRLQKDGILDVDRRRVSVLDPERLSALAGAEPTNRTERLSVG